MGNTVKDLMTTNLLVAKPSTALKKVYDVMVEKKIRHVPVVENDKVVGIISMKDMNLARTVIETDASTGRPSKIEMNAAYTVGQFMAFPVRTVPSDCTLLDAIQEIVTHKLESLLVVDDEALVGIVTTTDLLKCLADIISKLEISL